MAQAGRLVVRGDAGEALGDSIYEARIYVRGRCRVAGRRLHRQGDAARAPQRARITADGIGFRRRHRCLHPLRLGPRRSTTSTSTTPRPTDELHAPTTAPDWAYANPRRSTGRPSRPSTAPPRPASTTSADGAPSARCPTSTTCCSWARRCRATRWRATANGATPTSCSATATPNTRYTLTSRSPSRACRFGALSGPAKEALGRGASEVGTSTTTGDGGMTPEERGQSKYLVYQYLPSRYGMNPDDLRKADAIEVVLGQGAKPGGGGMLLGQKISPARRRDAHPARGHRPALGVPASRLDRARRPDDQDQRAAGDHRLGEADLRQGRRHPHVLRREARRARGRRRRRRRRDAGRHRGHAGGLHRARRDTDAGRGARRPPRRCRNSACTGRCS